MSLLLDIENLSFFYPSAQQPVLDKFSLKVHKGEFVFLVGANGSGKSTLFKLLTHQKKPSKGYVHLQTDSPHKHICYITPIMDKQLED